VLQGDWDGAFGERGVKASVAGEGSGEEHGFVVEVVLTVVFDADGETGVLLEAGGEQALELDVHARFTEGGIAVVQQESTGEGFVAVGELMEQERGSGGGVHPGMVTEQAQELEAESLAGMFLAGADVERGRERGGGDDVGVHGPESEEVELLGRAVEVLVVEVDDVVDQGAAIGFYGVGGGHKSP
jgi:hypothetical protein